MLKYDFILSMVYQQNANKYHEDTNKKQNPTNDDKF
jgi:hypothetical protein